MRPSRWRRRAQTRMGELRRAAPPPRLPFAPRSPGTPEPPAVTVSRCSPQEPQLGRGLHVSLHHLADPGQEEAPRGECPPAGRGSPQPGTAPLTPALCPRSSRSAAATASTTACPS